MRRLNLLTLIVAAALVMPAFAGKPPASKPAKTPATKPAKDVLAGPYYKAMIVELKLSDEQIALLRTKVAAKHDALDEWNAGPQGAKLVELRDARKAAVTSGKREQAREFAAQMKLLREERAALEADKQKEILSILDDKQARTWAGYGLYTSTCARFAGCELSDGQKAKVKTMALERAGEVKDLQDESQMKAARSQMAADVRQTVLTAQQVEALTSASGPASDRARK